MSLISDIKDLSYQYIKQHYDKYRLKKEKKKLSKEEINKFSNKFYDKKKYNLINFIRTNISKEYNESEVNSLIDEYVDDKEIVICRINSEIEIYQNISKKKSQ
jgi:hypothetical protein